MFMLSALVGCGGAAIASLSAGFLFGMGLHVVLTGMVGG